MGIRSLPISDGAIRPVASATKFFVEPWIFSQEYWLLHLPMGAQGLGWPCGVIGKVWVIVADRDS